MDLSTLNTSAAANGGIDLQLKHPVSGDLLPAWITICGSDSNIYEEKQLEIQRRRLELMASGRSTDGDAPARAAQDATELLAALTRGWRGLDRGEGKPLPYSDKAALDLYANRGYRWIREQVDQAIHTRALFLPGGTSN